MYILGSEITGIWSYSNLIQSNGLWAMDFVTIMRPVTLSETGETEGEDRSVNVLNKSCGQVGTWKPDREMERIDVTEAVSKELLERFATNGTHLEAHSRETIWGVLGWPVLFQSLVENSCGILPGLGSKMDLQCCRTCQRLLGLSTEMCLKHFRSVTTWEAGTRSTREFSVAGWNHGKTVSLEFVDISLTSKNIRDFQLETSFAFISSLGPIFLQICQALESLHCPEVYILNDLCEASRMMSWGQPIFQERSFWLRKKRLEKLCM